jgi:Zn-dependent protease/CBS domain-containing protein
MNGFRVGRLFGVELRIDASWVLIFILLAWNLTFVFGQWHPGWPPAMRMALAIIAALVFFGSVVLHELAHALVALAYGIPVSGITLFLFGGVSSLEKEPHAPHVELLTAIVGPLVSIGLGLLFLFLGGLFVHAPPPDGYSTEDYLATLGPVETLLLWLGPVNIMIGVFNLIPGFPLDGGRVLRALLWRITGNLHNATRWAARVGQAIGWTMIIFGVASAFGGRRGGFLGGGLAGGLWLAFIGWFLTSAARRSYEALLVEELLAGLTVSRLMRRTGTSMRANATVEELVNEGFLRGGERAFPVFDGESFVGVVALDDARRVPNEQWSTMRVRDVMTPLDRLQTTRPDEPLSEALKRITQADVGQLPVLENGKFVGMLERRDIARWIELRLHSQHLRPAPR